MADRSLWGVATCLCSGPSEDLVTLRISVDWGDTRPSGPDLEERHYGHHGRPVTVRMVQRGRVGFEGPRFGRDLSKRTTGDPHMAKRWC